MKKKEEIFPLYKTEKGALYLGKCEDVLKRFPQRANLILTSPPFPLNRKKKYGNMTGEEYVRWLKKMAILFKNNLADDGSIVIEMGNAWEKGKAVHSTLSLEALLALKKAGEFYLCQEFIYYNPSALPAPIEWVNKKRVRVKDSFTRIWWLSKTDNPKANNRNVLVPYSKQMKKLLEKGDYNFGKRPSEHIIGENSFNHNNGGAIPGNVIIASNTQAKGEYFDYCKENDLPLHPARMVKEIPEFFIEFLTDEDDLVLDPFAGSNTTGYIAEKHNRRWVGIEAKLEYAEGSRGRFV